MAQSSVQLQAKLMREYYKDFSKYAKGRPAARKVAWVTAFTPVEILEVLDIAYIYPESYAAVIAASGKEQPLLEESTRQYLCGDCCSYSCCFEGSLTLESAPRGLPPKPDVLIATNNQCNTLPNWWNILAQRYQVPLIVLDYPGEAADRESAYSYVTEQHHAFITQMEELSGNTLDVERLGEVIENSRASVEVWRRVTALFAMKDIPPTMLFDGISHLITSRCKPGTALLYSAMEQELAEMPGADLGKPALFWLGYPLWYHAKRYLPELLGNCRISGSNYITWWSLDYLGDTPLEQLFCAYNNTFLNLTPETKRIRLTECIRQSGAVGAIALRNKSCKCDFVSAWHIGIPQAELEIDMIDRNFLDVSRAKRQIEVLLESICTA